ncbi:MAG TPA: SDR family NAD(P)-dependent oxidoreductase [Phenylobacterium sp.]|uniref:SDR family NAD(P)-dependent oxidoreductase n=1 Tax=Phenylobacterium sp. TaxID=1871053 RepID=UPI002B4A4F95|nr:SDR family NAD(P)-dependent oxidoreductase [Phenylobacterium sp.]HKR90083.1 SDR family NAD(P)-dependent oxidoreductase [Phenylobacterium sp.]
MDPLPAAIGPGRTAVVTGAASGIGRAAARRFSELGMRLALADLDAAGLAETMQQLGGAGEGGHATFVVDVGDRTAVEDLAGQVAARFGRVSVLMNNAGVGGGGDALSNPDGWARVLGVNLLGALHGVQAFVPDMADSGEPGLVINTGSKQGVTQPPGDTAYNVSKSGVKALTEGLAHTLRNRPGCRVTAHLLIPGFTYTGMTARRSPERPPGAWTPEEVVERMLDGIGRGDFYILCQDNETTLEIDQKRILWHAQDLIENRPALSRWDPAWKAAFEMFMAG